MEILYQLLPIQKQKSLKILLTLRKLRKIMLLVQETSYVGYGAADIGVAGKDVLMEHGGDGLYEPLDLGIARCRLMVAGPENSGSEKRRLRIATKYVQSTRRYFADRQE